MKNKRSGNRKPLKTWLSLLTAFLLVFGELDASLVYALPVDEVSENVIIETVQETKEPEVQAVSTVSEDEPENTEEEEK